MARNTGSTTSRPGTLPASDRSPSSTGATTELRPIAPRQHVVVNHLHLREPVSDATAGAARDGIRLVVDAGALSARVAVVDERHLILVLEFATADDAERIAREVGGPWMRENIKPLLAGDTERSVGEVIASAEA
jgi:hypothetical protein